MAFPFEALPCDDLLVSRPSARPRLAQRPHALTLSTRSLRVPMAWSMENPRVPGARHFGAMDQFLEDCGKSDVTRDPRANSSAAYVAIEKTLGESGHDVEMNAGLQLALKASRNKPVVELLIKHAAECDICKQRLDWDAAKALARKHGAGRENALALLEELEPRVASPVSEAPRTPDYQHEEPETPYRRAHRCARACMHSCRAGIARQ